jgi:hypothetical protein
LIESVVKHGGELEGRKELKREKMPSMQALSASSQSEAAKAGGGRDNVVSRDSRAKAGV